MARGKFPNWKRRKRRPARIKNLGIPQGGQQHCPPVPFGTTLLTVHSTIRGVSAWALQKFAARACRAAGLGAAVNILITSSAHMRRLNRRFRGKNAATDVLAFPAEGKIRSGAETRRRPLSEISGGCLGDIAISAQVAARNARRLGHSTADEVKVLILHGLLHLAGYDHERDEGEMARKEAGLRQRLRLPTALIERASTASRNGSGRGTAKKRRS
jgi:probable rRNA maturation factor